jgi:tetratricopeptide (TPR) repeat protein
MRNEYYAAGVGDLREQTRPQLAGGGKHAQQSGELWLVIVATWRAAEQLYQQALAISEKLAPNSLDVARTLNNLGTVACNRGDLAAAERYLQQALAIYEKLAPNSLQVATHAQQSGECGLLIVATWRAAEQYYQQALAIYEKLAPNSLDVAGTLNNLGTVAYDRGDLAAAERYLQQALAIYEKLAPNSLAGGNHAQQSGHCGS